MGFYINIFYCKCRPCTTRLVAGLQLRFVRVARRNFSTPKLPHQAISNVPCAHCFTLHARHGEGTPALLRTLSALSKSCRITHIALHDRLSELRGLPVDVWAATAGAVPAQLTWEITNYRGLDLDYDVRSWHYLYKPYALYKPPVDGISQYQSAEYELTGDQAWRRDYYYDGPGDQAVVNNAYAMEHACEETE